MSTDHVLTFLEALAVVRQQFRALEIRLAENEKLRNVSVSTANGRSVDTPYFSFFFDADFVEDCREGAPIGLSLRIDTDDGDWRLESYLHFPGGDVDWYDFKDFEIRFESVERLIAALPDLSEQALGQYENAVSAA